MLAYSHETWHDSNTPRSREFLVQLEMWYSSKYTPNALRKSNTARKKPEKRDSFTQNASQADDSPRKLKERPSWFTIPRVASSNNSAGQWRAATCKLSEDGDSCVLNIYGEDNSLQHSLFVHLLRSTDIRFADRSLFFRPDCLGIHCRPGHGMTTFGFLEPIYLSFANTDAINTWVALLRSYSQPEVYGRRLDPAGGGLYRMWRQVELVVIQGRNLRLGKVSLDHERTLSPHSGGDDRDDSMDLDTFCEILLNNEISGRTTVKKGTGAPYWHETLTFSDLPSFGILLINVWRERKLVKPSLIGTLEIGLSTLHKGEFVEGWFPVISSHTPGQQVGEIKLKTKVDEEIILPIEAYASVLETLDSRNSLEVLSELEQKMRLEHISSHIMSLAVSRNMLMHDICELAAKEVEQAPTTHNTLFRGNTVLTKTMELAMAWYGKSFLESSVGPIIRRMCNERVAIEVDPARSGKGPKDVDQNVKLLAYWCDEFWAQIWHVRGECPHELRRLFQHIRLLVEKKFGLNNDLRWQSVSAFCFLRFIVPAILHPHLFGLCPGLPPAGTQRSLTLVAKVIQSLANLNTTIQKEDFMRGMKTFMDSNLPAMVDYILVVSTPVPEQFGPFPPAVADKHDRLHVTNSLRERLPTLPTLHREAVPLLPYLVDIPKHLAIVTSAVVRGMRNTPQSLVWRPPSIGTQARLEEFTTRCFEVETRALQSVNQLASRAVSTPYRMRSGSVSVSVDSFRGLRRPTTSASQSTPGITLSEKNSPPQPAIPRRRAKSLRPSTAPSSSSSPSPPVSSSDHSFSSETAKTAPAGRVSTTIYTTSNQSSKKTLPRKRPVTAPSYPKPLDSPGSESLPSTPRATYLNDEGPSTPFSSDPISGASATDLTGDDASRKRKGFFKNLLNRK